MRLPEASAALAYFAGDSREPVLRFFFLQDRVVAHELKASNAIEAEIHALLKDDPVGAEGIRRQLAADLFPSELAAVLPAKSIKRILIMPEAGMNKISFESLIPSTGAEVPRASLIDYAAVTLVPSILAWPSDAGRHDQRSDALIVTAAHQASCPESLRLPWAEKEADNVAGFASSGSRHLSGAEAVDAILGDEASHYRILHLAVHGQSARNLNGSELMLDCSSDNTLRGDRIKAARLSGQLVVLSSCESAVGETNGGGGIDSLADVFLQAGASCVIAARSSLSDKSAYDLMGEFYRQLAANQPVDVALQQTQIAWEQKVPARQWAAFSAFGKCDNPVPITPSLWKRIMHR
jgi:CHAT domain-containing protein